MIDRANLKDLYPLSPMQEGMLYHALREPDSTAYFEQISYRLSGTLDMALFERAWNELVARHDILRTLFVFEKTKRPLQVVLKSSRMEFRFKDLRGQTPEDHERAVLAKRDEDKRRGFDLTQGPLMRAWVLQLDENVYEVIWSHHHILMDGWCVARLQGEFLQVYQALQRNERPSLPAVKPYSHYLQWLEKQDRSQGWRFWEDYLSGYTELATIPKLSRVDARQPYDLQKQILELDEAASLAFRELATQWQVTPNTLFQCLWGILLGRYNNTDDVVFGAVVSGRPAELPGVEGIFGLFINTIPVRVRIAPELRLRELAVRLQTTAVQSAPHHYCSLSEIQSHSLLKEKLLDHLVVFENYPIEESHGTERSGFSVERVERFEQTNYDFVVIVEPGKCTRVEFQYNASVYSAAQITRLAGHVLTLFQAALARPDARVLDLPMLTRSELHLLASFNSSRGQFPGDRCVHQLFEEQAKETPDAVALVLNKVELTYRELNGRANQLARHLQCLGVAPEDFVGIYADRSFEMIVGLLAILKAGGVYVPLDPGYPSERLDFLVQDARLKVVLTQSPLIALRPLAPPSKPSSLSTSVITPRCRVLCFEAIQESVSQQNSENLPNHITSENLAYVCYTSGSTGEPKGVCVRHRSVVRLVKGANFAQFNRKDIWLQFAPVSFDASVLEIWGCLLNGARLVIMPPGPASLEELGEVIQRCQITSLWLTAGLFHLMVEKRLSDLKSVRQLFAGGDVLSAAHVRKALEELQNCTVINGYGPTENTTFTCCYPMTSPAQAESTVPIGCPIAHTQVYILDRHLRPVPVGIAGELHTGGDGLARCYLNSPARTAEKFIPDPFCGIPGARLYETGDLARYREDGNIEFLGRTDRQIKLRGFRIELGEVESALAAYPLASEAVVLLRVEPSGDKRLVAYVTGKGELALSVPALREFLEARLPDYMVPSLYVILDAMPLTANGKIDRGALPAPDANRRDEVAPNTVPRNPDEAIIAGIWAEVLGVDQVGIHENFFALGGHSLKATQIISQMRTKLRLEVPMRILFEKATIAEITEEMQKMKANGTAHPQSPGIVRRARSEYRLAESESDVV
jgi:surfactin family lipopeptide synthetase C